MDVPVEEPLFMRIVGRCTKSGFGAGANGSIGFDKMDGCFKLIAGDFRKSGCDRGVLEWQIIQTVACNVSPTSNPDAAEVTITVEDHEWLCWRRCDLIGGFHCASNS